MATRCLTRSQAVLLAGPFQPVAPAASQRAKSPSGGLSVIAPLCELQPPRIRARLCRRPDSPQDCAVIGYWTLTCGFFEQRQPPAQLEHLGSSLVGRPGLEEDHRQVRVLGEPARQH
jgi:hypothetical protein